MLHGNPFITFCGILLICTVSRVSVAQLRLIPHLTNQSGGFESEIILVNASSAPQGYHLQGFDSEGVLQSSITRTLSPFQSISGTDLALFGTQLSHVQVSEGTQIAASVRFRASRDGTGSAHVHESSRQSDRWRIYPGENSVTWDGIAMVNTGDNPGMVSVSQIGASGQVVNGPIVIATAMPVMGKRLYLFEADFPSVDQTVFEITANVPLAVLALRGNLGSDYIWENQAISVIENPVTEPRYLVHITSAVGGFSSQLIVSNPTAETQPFELRAYDAMGGAIQDVLGSVNPGESLYQNAQSQLGSGVSHVEVIRGNVLNISVAYQRNGEATGPAHVHSSQRSSRAWLVFPGTFEVTWDGIALLNLGTSSAHTRIWQVSQSGAVLRGPITASTELPPKGKALYLFSQDFDAIEASHFEVISSEPTMVLALRGNLNSDLLWENQAVPFTTPKAGAKPPSRIDFAIAFDQVHQQTIMVGGFDSAFDLLADTWSWNGRRWTEIMTPVSPMARAHHAGAFNEFSHQMVIFGGFDSPPSKRNDFMSFDGLTWASFPGASQIPADDGELVFDSARNILILVVSNGTTLETWEHEQQAWTRINTPTQPVSVIDQAVTYDPLRHNVVLFGGLAPGNRIVNETWEYDGHDWSSAAPATSPPPLMGMASWYDTQHQRFVVFGGMNDSREWTNETWSYDGSDWERIVTSTSPTPRWVMFAAYHPGRGVATLFGGEADGASGSELLNDTWEFDGTDWREVNLGQE